MTDSNQTDRAFIKVIAEDEASAKVRDLYNEIKETLGIDFVPNMYMALAQNPEYLEMTWRRVQAVMGKEGSLGRKTKDIVALTVSIMSGCEYCTRVYNQAVKHGGLDDVALLELYEVIDLYSGLNRLNIGLQTKADEKAWHGCGGR